MVWRDNVLLFRTTLAQNPNANKIREYLADDLRRMGDMEAAREEYEEIVRQDPQYEGIDHAYNNLGDYHRQQNDVEKAQEYYEKSIMASSGGNYKSYNNLGALFLEQGENLKALTNFCKALQIDPLAPEPQSNYNLIVSSIYGVDDSQFIFLYSDVMSGDTFQASQDEGIIFKRKSCAYGSCLYSFTPQLQEREILFPFLIMATAFPQEVIRVSNAEFNGGANEIILTLPDQYQNRLITFSFPTCSGVRYEVQVSP